MNDERQLRDDLSYVRSVLLRARDSESPAVIYFLWAAISFFGFAMIDYSPEMTGLYWMIAGPVGGVLSAILGWRFSRTLGQTSLEEGQAHVLHWTGVLVACFLVVLLSAANRIGSSEIPRLILLIVSLSYFTAGVHLDRRLLWVGIALGGCFLFTVWGHEVPRLWTITGAALAASLVVAGVFAVRSRRFAGTR